MRNRAAKTLTFLAAFAAATASSSALAQAPDIGALFREILADPTDVAANLRYAQAVEARGESRKALMAYERVLSVEPTNAIARHGLARLTGQPAPGSRTETLAGVGVQYESNPRLLDTGLSRDGDVSLLATLRVEDERMFLDERWRSRLSLQGRLYASFDEGTVGYAGIDTGPMLSLGTVGSIRPMLGAEHARLIDGPLFSSVYGGAELALVGLGPLHGIDAIVSFADFSERFPGRDGFLLRLRPQLAVGLATAGDRLTVEPEASWNAAVGEDQRYRYWGLGVTAYYSLPLADSIPMLGRLTGGPEAAVEYRSYAGRAPEETDDRRDWRFVPGVRLIGSEFLGQDVSVMLRYTLDRNRSTEAAKEYTNHSVSLMFYRRF